MPAFDGNDGSKTGICAVRSYLADLNVLASKVEIALNVENAIAQGEQLRDFSPQGSDLENVIGHF
jgi:hypothetical protein